MPATTTRLSLPYPTDTDPADGPAGIGGLANAIDPIIPPFSSGTLAARPAATLAGRFYYATDTGLLYFATGSAWVTLNEPPTVDWVAGDLRFTAINVSSPTAITGWLLCNGDAYSRTTESALFAAIGTNYGVGNGSTTFNVPDYRGRVAVGIDPGGVAIPSATTRGVKGGIKEVTLTGRQSGVQQHTHNVTDPQHSHRPDQGGGESFITHYDANSSYSVLTGAGVGIITTDDTDAFTGSASTGITINNAGHTGAIDPTPIVQPFQTCNVLIKK